MRKMLLATAATGLIGLGPALAQETPVKPLGQGGPSTETTGSTSEGFGAAAGGATGAVAGAVVGGPVGAVVGGFAGAVLGAETAVPEPAVRYVVSNPVEPVVLEGPVEAGVVVPQTAELMPIPDYPDYAYLYTERRPLIVRADTREVVYSPGYVLPESTITYVRQNPVEPVTLEGRVSVGATLPPDVTLRPIPEDPAYSYVYLDTGPALVESRTRTVIWAQ